MKSFWTLLLFLLTAAVLVTSCGRDSLSSSDRERLQAEYNLRLNELRTASLGHTAGWPSDADCDGALWAGVARAAGADWVDISAAVQADGRPTRIPYADCGPGDMGYNGGSATTVSNDMITGIMLGLYASNDPTTAKLLWDYGYTHAWIMGEPNWYAARVLLRPNGITMLARLLYSTSSGRYDYAARWSAVIYGPVVEDYEGHLLLLGRYLQTRLGGPQYGMETSEYLMGYYKKDDALAQAVAGKYSASARLLLGDYKSPSYVRGHESYPLVHWLLAARITLDNG